MAIGLKANQKGSRTIGRRMEDIRIRRHIQRFKSLFVLGQSITSEIRLNILFLLINEKTNQILKAKRSTVFLYDNKTDELWSFVATGMGKGEIRISADTGIAGWVFRNRQSALINDVYEDPRFFKAIDDQSGFKTENIVCIPLFNRDNKCIGVLQALNSKAGQFTREDERFLEAISGYVAIALENAKLYHDVKVYAEDLKKALILNESLEKLKHHLKKFVPQSVVAMAEQEPDALDRGKVIMDVSVLFVDVIGFSRITENYDQELVNHMIETHFSAYLGCVHSNGGEVNETSGDGVMVIFRADADDNHAMSAIRSGLEIIHENQRLNEKFKYPWGRVGIHLGISSGEGHVGTTRMSSAAGERWTYTASGLVTVLAARIGSISKDSKLYVSDNTYAEVKDLCDVEMVGKRELKNVSRKVTVYWVKGLLNPAD